MATDAMLLGSSSRSAAAAMGELHDALSARTDADAWSRQLFAVVDALDESVSLQRSLTNPNRDEGSKRDLVKNMLKGMDDAFIRFVANTAVRRWSRDADLGQAMEMLAFEAKIAHVEASHSLEKVEDEFFEVDRFLIGQRDLREALGDDDAAPEAREKLCLAVFSGKLSPDAVEMLYRLAGHPRGRHMANSLVFVSNLIAQRRKRLVAQVIAAIALSDTQLARLGKILERQLGHSVQVNLTVDPEVIGGLRVRVGDTAINATVLRRLFVAHKALTA